MFSLPALVALLVVLSGAHLLFKKVNQAVFTSLRHVPGPWYAPWTRLRLKAAILGGRRMHCIDTLHAKYGPVVRIAPTEIAISDPSAVKTIHRIGSGFLKDPWYLFLNSGGYDAPPGIFNMLNPKQHAVRRKMFARGFSQNHIRDYWESSVRDRVDLAVARIREDSARFGSVDVLKWWTFMTSDISAHLMFGESFHMLESGVRVRYIEAIGNTGITSAFMAELYPLYLLGVYSPIRTIRNIFRSNKYVLEQGKQAVINSRTNSKHANIFTTIVSEAEKGETLSDYDVQVEAGNLIVAGTDTTAISLTYLTWAVLSQPDLRNELEREVSELTEPFRDADLERLLILNSVIDETLRLYSAAPGTLPRVVPRGGATLGGYFLPEGTTVGTQAYTQHRQPNLFSDPEKFDHTRWLTPDGVSSAARDVYLPFGGGTRICIGIHLAKMELRLAAAKFFRECPGARLAPSTTDECMEMVNFFLISPKGRKCEIVL